MNSSLFVRSLLAILCVAVIPTKALGHGSVHQRIDAATAAIEQDPDNAELYAQRANLWYVDESWIASASDFARAIELEPPSMDLRLGYASALRRAGRFDEALQIYDACLRDEPGKQAALLGRARSLAGRGDRAEAALAYEELAQTRDHMGPEIYTEHCTVLAEMGGEHLDKAIRILDLEMQKTGLVLPFQAQAIKLENRRGAYPAAARRLQVLIDLPGRDEFWLSRQGDALMKAGRTEEANEKFQLALDAIADLSNARRGTRAVQELTEQLTLRLSRDQAVQP